MTNTSVTLRVYNFLVNFSDQLFLLNRELECQAAFPWNTTTNDFALCTQAGIEVHLALLMIMQMLIINSYNCLCIVYLASDSLFSTCCRRALAEITFVSIKRFHLRSQSCLCVEHKEAFLLSAEH